MPYKRVTDAQMIKAIRHAEGILRTAAENLGCTRQTVYSRVQRSEKVAAALKEAREATIDTAESKLLEQVRKGDVRAIKFYLSCQGKDRGYVERSEHTVDNRHSGHLDMTVDDARKELRQKLDGKANRLASILTSEPGGNGRHG